MSNKTIFSIGFSLPGDDFEYIEFDSDRSLLDADIVLYEVGFGSHYPSETYQGESLFPHSTSVAVARNIQHWRSELSAAIGAGKLVLVYLAKPRTYFRYTGQQQHSGTGRSQTTTNFVALVSSYDAIPKVTSAEPKSGREVMLTKEANYLVSYWKEFQQYSDYETFVDGKFSHNLLITKAGSKVVGAAVRDKGVMLLLPPLRYNDYKFTRYDEKTEKSYWTKEALQFGKHLAAALTSLSDVLLSGRVATPPPTWVLDSAFVTPEEGALHGQLAEIEKDLSDLQQKQSVLDQQLEEAGSIRALLYEQGKPLEHAVRNALLVLGFTARPFSENDSEFDVIFESAEGRCLGEVEGKDNKAINIDKFSQLERNLHEDFAREGVTEYAKGVLFGNAERLKILSERSSPFTTKCLTAAQRLHVALVRTSDLFDPVRYLRTYPDPDYAKACRQAILSSAGGIVTFPTIPIRTTTEIKTGKVAD